MSLENTFYVVALIYMSLGMLLLIALLASVFYIKKKVTQLEKTFSDKLEIISSAAAHPGEAALGIGASIADAAIDKIKEAFEKKKKTK